MEGGASFACAQNLSACEGWSLWDDSRERQEFAASDADLSSFLDFILSQDVPDLSPRLFPEIRGFDGDVFLAENASNQDFLMNYPFCDPVENHENSREISGISVNFEDLKSKDNSNKIRWDENQNFPMFEANRKGAIADTYQEVESVYILENRSPNGSSSLSATAPEAALAREDRPSRSRIADDRGRSGESPTRSLTSDPDDDRRKIRLMKNREAALQSRQRKKSYVKDLEVKCRMLESHCKNLEQSVALKNMENCVLKEELSRVKRSKGHATASACAAEPAVLVKDSLPLEFLLHRAHNSGGPCLVWTLPLLFLLLLLLPTENQPGGALGMEKTSTSPREHKKTCNRKRARRGRQAGQKRRSVWRFRRFAHHRKRKKGSFAFIFPAVEHCV